MKISIAVSVGLLCGLVAACQSITKAPEGSQRVEVEVAVDVDPSYSESVEGLDEQFTEEVTDRVLARSDMGLRFYPVHTREYGKQDTRPEYFMTVQIKDLVVDLAHKMVEEEGEEPRIVTSVSTIRCRVLATIKKRRESGPDLTVAKADGSGSTKPTKADRIPETAVTYEVVRKAEDAEVLSVTREDLDKAIDLALTSAMRGLLEPVDRELTIASSSPSS